LSDAGVVTIWGERSLVAVAVLLPVVPNSLQSVRGVSKRKLRRWWGRAEVVVVVA
jgi:hypothetical protein